MIRRALGIAIILAVAVVAGLAIATPASASCVGSPPLSAYAFTGTVTSTTHNGRVATVRTDLGRTVIMVGTPDRNATGTSVDRLYVVGARYEFHPINGESPYQDNACTRTRQVAREGPSAADPGTPSAPKDDGNLPLGWMAVAGGAIGAIAAVTAFVIIRSRRGAGGAGSGRT